MQLTTNRGLVLRRTRYQEKDLKLTLFLREIGKLSVIGKGASQGKSKLRALYEPFVEADYHVAIEKDHVHARLVGGQLIDSHTHLRQNVQTFEVACQCVEVVDVLVPYRAPSPEVFDILQAILPALKDHQFVTIHWMRFVVLLLKILGHGDFSGDAAAALGAGHEARDFFSQIDAPIPEELVDQGQSSDGMAFVRHRLEQVLPWRLKSERALES